MFTLGLLLYIKAYTGKVLVGSSSTYWVSLDFKIVTRYALHLFKFSAMFVIGVKARSFSKNVLNIATTLTCLFLYVL
jgi:hypothetical protein